MPWWSWLIIGGAVFIVAVTVAVMVLVFGVFRSVRGEFDQTWKNVNSPLWTHERTERPAPRRPRPPSGFGR